MPWNALPAVRTPTFPSRRPSVTNDTYLQWIRDPITYAVECPACNQFGQHGMLKLVAGSKNTYLSFTSTVCYKWGLQVL
jgi:hypothetical protein